MTTYAAPPAPQTGPDGTPASRPLREIRPGEPEEVISLVASALGVVGLICLWMVLQLLVLGGASEARSQHLLYSQFRTSVSQEISPLGALDYDNLPVRSGTPVATVEARSIGLSQVVVFGTSPNDLLDGPGLYRTTQIPGQQGISVVLARSTTYGGPFRHIDQLAVGDQITVQDAQGKVVYTVQDVRRAGDPIPAAPTGAQGRLTLVTSEGGGFLSGLRPGNVVYVDALAKKAFPPGVVVPGPLPAAELSMGRDTSGFPILVLLLTGLLAIVAVVSVASRRFRPVLVWTFATPCVLALAWALTDQVMRLLPNLV